MTAALVGEVATLALALARMKIFLDPCAVEGLQGDAASDEG